MRIRGQYVLPKIISTVGNAALALMSRGSRNSSAAYRMFRTFDHLQEVSDKQLRQTIQYAIGKKYIRVTHRSGNSYVELTREGKKLCGKFAVEALKPAKQKVWDGKWRMVLFDIPETYKQNRDGFAANLKRLGFVQIQKSVFAFPYPCFEEIEVLADFHHVRPFLTCAMAETLFPTKSLERHFKLG